MISLKIIAFSAATSTIVGMNQTVEAQTTIQQEIKHYLQSSYAQERFTQLTFHYKTLFSAMLPTAHVHIFPSDVKDVKKLINLFFAELDKTIFNWQTYQKTLIQHYKTFLSQDDLKVLIAYANTPIGKHFYAQQTLVLNEYTILDLKKFNANKEKTAQTNQQENQQTTSLTSPHELAALEFIQQGFTKKYLNPEAYRDLLNADHTSTFNTTEQAKLAKLLVPAYIKAFSKKELEQLLKDFNEPSHLPIFQRLIKAEAAINNTFEHKLNEAIPKSLEKVLPLVEE